MSVRMICVCYCRIKKMFPRKLTSLDVLKDYGLFVMCEEAGQVASGRKSLTVLPRLTPRQLLFWRYSKQLQSK
jgi:hypothetical protein